MIMAIYLNLVLSLCFFGSVLLFYVYIIAVTEWCLLVNRTAMTVYIVVVAACFSGIPSLQVSVI